MTLSPDVRLPISRGISLTEERQNFLTRARECTQGRGLARVPAPLHKHAPRCITIRTRVRFHTRPLVSRPVTRANANEQVFAEQVFCITTHVGALPLPCEVPGQGPRGAQRVDVGR